MHILEGRHSWALGACTTMGCECWTLEGRQTGLGRTHHWTCGFGLDQACMVSGLEGRQVVVLRAGKFGCVAQGREGRQILVLVLVAQGPLRQGSVVYGVSKD